ncbi:MAG: D-aminoacyl-tRNA deacylase [Desulfitobacteriaceae bacterium]|nr:D-aminoacyl-tRNA deacylase [Desulfitobacteriaceae bacterium]MDD4345835.1 D-aminoacyl-tRNA deacylase [Desulfitobacteriaceae bacterium]MDD4401315.1 D-aminoacyl-tRNA deacylase [Desulfitobacteriaceae bacterium]
MRSLVQRVKKANVKVQGNIVGSISSGILVFLGVGKDDTQADLNWMVKKLVDLRIFEDKDRKMNYSIKDISGEILLVSQFTLYGDCRKGNRPSFSEAALPDTAKGMYKQVIEAIIQRGIKLETGTFGAEMEVELVNDGPVTFLLDSKKG